MKIYTSTIDVAKPVEHKFWTAPHSDYAFGVKLAKDGTAIDNSLSVYEGSTALTAEASTIGGYTIYKKSSGSSGSSRFTVKVADVDETFEIVNIITDSSVFERGGEGGGGTTYTAGDGIGIEGNVISLTATVPQVETVTESEWAELSASAVAGKLYFVIEG